MADTLQQTRIHPDYLRCIKVSRRDAYLELFTRRYAHAGRPVGLPELAVTLGEVQNDVVGVSLDSSVHCVKVYHNLDHLDVLYRVSAITAAFNLQLHWNHVVSRCSEYCRPWILFIFLLLK